MVFVRKNLRGLRFLFRPSWLTHTELDIYEHPPTAGSAAFNAIWSVITPRTATLKAAPCRKRPSFRQRRGYNQAIVTLTDASTKERCDYWMGA
jgi:hypothetical protein